MRRNRHSFNCKFNAIIIYKIAIKLDHLFDCLLRMQSMVDISGGRTRQNILLFGDNQSFKNNYLKGIKINFKSSADYSDSSCGSDQTISERNRTKNSRQNRPK